MTGSPPQAAPPGIANAIGRRADPPFRIVAVGASAGGLDAFRRLVAAIPTHSGAAYILVQHMDPNHQSLLVELIADHARIPVTEAVDGAPLSADHIYVIPPRAFLAVEDFVLRLTSPATAQGARLPFDALLSSLADRCGPLSAAVVLSGTGADGSQGAIRLKARGGLVFAQSPEEAEYDGMPRSVIATGTVDAALPAAEIPEALARRWTMTNANPVATSPPENPALQGVIDLVRSRKELDFHSYKPGTIRRRIARRIGLSGLAAEDFDGYLQLLSKDAQELERLTSDLLINVTAFFRDPHIFEAIAVKAIPDIVAAHEGDGPIRVWVAGCSNGQEAYSLAMLFVESLEAAHSKVDLQIFASDIDAEAIARARTGLYPATIASEVTAQRLQRFFLHEGDSYRVRPELRNRVVFSVQDLLKDPPFSRLDMVSCRNLLIYFGPEAQARAIALFHFALAPGGLLLLGGAEAPAHSERKFTTLSKVDRTYRRVDQHRTSGLEPHPPGFLPGTRAAAPPQALDRPARINQAADLCRNRVLVQYGPPTVLINADMECIYSLGDLDPYLRVPAGDPTRSVLDLARSAITPTLRTAIHLALHGETRAALTVHPPLDEAAGVEVRIEATPLRLDGAPLLMISFIAQPSPASPEIDPALADEGRDGLMRELQATRTQLQAAISDLDLAAAEQKALNEEAMSIQEEYQSTNEELMTSKEELQSLNEELTALNTQLQETLDHQRSASNDLQNVLFSTNVATLFLDQNLKIRFYTPATTALFHLIPTDIGRPLADLKSLADDRTLLDDAQRVLDTQASAEHEIEVGVGAWFERRIFPYVSKDSSVNGVVITFADVTAQRRAASAVNLARSDAERANLAKSRFLAAASHDLRQPLQTLALLQGLLAKTVTAEDPSRLIVRFDETLSAMSGMLNTLLDINQIEAGEVRPVRTSFCIGEVLTLIREEFTYHAQAKRLELRVANSTALVTTDQRLLEQILRNLVANALKYTSDGQVLVGCRRRNDRIWIEVWDTGVGIPDADQLLIFDEYHQLDNEARERSKGMGLGLSIVQRLAVLLNHRIIVHSTPGRGSMFALELPRTRRAMAPLSDPRLAPGDPLSPGLQRTGDILLVEDDPELRELLEQFLIRSGHRVRACSNGPEALAAERRERFAPNLILIDFNLPGGLDGVQTAQDLNRIADAPAAVIVLTGDISTAARMRIEAAGAMRLSKPVKPTLLGDMVQRALTPGTPDPADVATVLAPGLAKTAPATARHPPPDVGPIIYVVDDDAQLRRSLREALEADSRFVADYGSCEEFLEGFSPHREACLLLDAYLPGMTGLELLRQLKASGRHLPTVVITGHSDIEMAVNAMKAGAIDFIEKPVSYSDLISCIDRALERSRDANRLADWHENAVKHIRSLTQRQRQVMDLVLAGHPSKNIAADLGISQRTVENHRASIMHRTGARSLPALARLAMAAAQAPEDWPAGEGHG